MSMLSFISHTNASSCTLISEEFEAEMRQNKGFLATI